MRIALLCNLYNQIHFTGAPALPGLSEEWDLSAAQMSLFIRPKGVAQYDNQHRCRACQ